MAILQRISQLGMENSDVPPTAPFGRSHGTLESENVDRESKRIDWAAHQYLLHSSATKIQAVVRGFLYRKKDLEATMKIVGWLQQNKPLDMMTVDDVAGGDDTMGAESPKIEEETEGGVDTDERDSQKEFEKGEAVVEDSEQTTESFPTFAERQMAFLQEAAKSTPPDQVRLPDQARWNDERRDIPSFAAILSCRSVWTCSASEPLDVSFPP